MNPPLVQPSLTGSIAPRKSGGGRLVRIWNRIFTLAVPVWLYRARCVSARSLSIAPRRGSEGWLIEEPSCCPRASAVAFRWRSSCSVCAGPAKYGISYRDLAEMMQERAVEVDASTIFRWVQRYAPEIDKRVRRYQGRRSGSWRVDETSVRVGGQWKYLLRAIDKYGQLITFMLSDRRNTQAAYRFLRKAVKTMRTAPATLKGFEVMRMIHRGHCAPTQPGATGEIRLVNQLFGLAT